MALSSLWPRFYGCYGFWLACYVAMVCSLWQADQAWDIDRFSESICDAFYLKVDWNLVLQEHHFSMLQQETERLRTDIDKMRNESKFVTSLLNTHYGPWLHWLQWFGLWVLQFKLIAALPDGSGSSSSSLYPTSLLACHALSTLQVYDRQGNFRATFGFELRKGVRQLSCCKCSCWTRSSCYYSAYLLFVWVLAPSQVVYILADLS